MFVYALFDVKMTILRTHTHVALILQICHTKMEEVASVAPIWQEKVGESLSKVTWMEIIS